MNDAFSTLKGMIPACRGADERDGSGKEMHKLDVLNAGIEYLRYLEKCLERMNERQWEAKHAETRSTQKEEAKEEGEEKDDDDDDDEDLREYRRSVSLERQSKGQGHQHYSRRQDKEEDREKMNRNPHEFLRSCHCHCHCHSHYHARENECITFPPRLPAPLATPSPLLLQQQKHDHAVHRIHESATINNLDTVRDRDRDRDREETTNTAAALLMLTSTDRRDNIKSNTDNTAGSISSASNHPLMPSIGAHHPAQTQTHSLSPLWKTETWTPAIKGGLSVRDLLLK
jgi:hypothetical protein